MLLQCVHNQETSQPAVDQSQVGHRSLRMPRHSTGKMFDNSVHNVTNVQEKYARFLQETIAAKKSTNILLFSYTTVIDSVIYIVPLMKVCPSNLLLG